MPQINGSFLLLFFKKEVLSFLLLACLACDILLARSIHPNADMAQNFAELVSVLQGNVLLSHWILAKDNYFFTDLPMFEMLGVVFGPRHWLIYVAPVLVYAALLLAAMRLVGRARAWPAVAVLLWLGVPFAPMQFMFLVPAYHTSTAMFCLLAVLTIKPALDGGRFRWPWLMPFFMLVFAAVASDPLSDILLVVPTLSLILLRLWLHPAWRVNDWLIAGVTVAAAVLGSGFAGFMPGHHGFYTNMNFSAGLVPSFAAVWSNVVHCAGFIGSLAQARTGALPPFIGARVFALVRLVGLALLIGGCLRSFWRMPRVLNAGTPQLLVLGAASLLLADIGSGNFYMLTVGQGFNDTAARFAAPAFLFMSVAGLAAWAHCEMRGVFPRVFAIIALLVWAFGVAQVVAVAARRPAGLVASPAYGLAQWLQARHFTYGVADYWTASLVTTASDGNVVTDAVLGANKILYPYPLANDMTWFMAGRLPQFIVIMQENINGLTVARAEQSYGVPAQIDQVGIYQVLITK